MRTFALGWSLSKHALALTLAALSVACTVPVVMPVAVPTPRPVAAEKFQRLYPGVYTPREADLVKQYLAANAALQARGPIDVQKLINGELPKDTPGLGPVIKASEDWVRYNNAKVDPENPLRNDRAYARGAGFSDIQAFPTFAAHDDTFMVPYPPAARDTLLVSDLNHSVTTYRPIYPGDTLFLVADARELIDLTPAAGSIYRTIAINSQGSIYNQRGEKVNDVVFRVTESIKLYQDPNDAPKNPGFFDMWEAPDWLARPAHVYTDADWDRIKDIWRNEKRQGAEPLYWEDVKVGDRPATTLDGPILASVAPVPPWGMGSGGSRSLKREIMEAKTAATLIRGARDGIWRTAERAGYVPQTPPQPAGTGVSPLPPDAGAITTTDIHKDGEQRSPLVNYVGRDLAIRHLSNWMGDKGWLHNIRWSIMDPRAHAAYGKPSPANPAAVRFLDQVPGLKGRHVTEHGLTQDVAIVKSQVVGKEVRDGAFLVDIVWWVETIDGKIWEEGGATVKLPSRGASGPSGGMPPPGMPPAAPVDYRAAVLIEDGAVKVDAASTTAGARRVQAKAARGVTIRSATDRFNGLLVRGKSDFTLADSRIELSGKGLSDFDGIAAGALVKDDATMVLRNVRITTRGVVSSAATATDNTTMKVYRSTLVAEGGPVPSGYVRRIGPGMMEPPTPLGIAGTARTSLTMGSAKSYFYDSTIIADGWGALSTDAARGAYLEANRCDIRVRRSGYGTYADNGASVVINHSKMDVPTFGGVIAGQASLALNGSTVLSGGNGVMIHSVMGSPAEVARLSIKGGRLATVNAAILVKSANAEITVDGTQIVAKNGDLLLGVVNDDTNATQVGGQPVAGIKATFRDAALAGNIVHLDTDRRMLVTVLGSTLAGAVRDATLSLDARSRWTATADSKLRLAAPTRLEQIDAPVGVRIDATAEPGVLPLGQYTLRSGGMLAVR